MGGGCGILLACEDTNCVNVGVFLCLSVDTTFTSPIILSF